MHFVSNRSTLENQQSKIAASLAAFGDQPLRTAALGLLDALGYRSEKTLELDGTPEAFLEAFPQHPDRPFNRDKAHVDDWREVPLLFQLTDDECRLPWHGRPAHDPRAG